MSSVEQAARSSSAKAVLFVIDRASGSLPRDSGCAPVGVLDSELQSFLLLALIQKPQRGNWGYGEGRRFIHPCPVTLPGFTAQGMGLRVIIHSYD